jgi:hypothetical protein
LAGAFDEVADGVEGKDQQVEDHEQGVEVLLAASEVVLEVVAALLENVEPLVLDLPARPAVGRDLGGVVLIDRWSVTKALRSVTLPRAFRTTATCLSRIAPMA